MQIVIPTLGRATIAQQSTLCALAGIDVRPTLLVNYEEYDTYYHEFSQLADIAAPAAGVHGIGPIRDYAIEHFAGTDGKVCMMDDDLTFYTRREDDRTKFAPATAQDFNRMLFEIDKNLDLFPLVGIASREGGNRNTEDFMYCTRILRLLAYDARVLNKHSIHFSDIPVMEDFHVALELLTRGYGNLVLNNYCHNQFGSGLKGGCSTYRTPAVQAQAAHELKRMYPQFVDVVQKETKGAWGGGTRTDVRIAWKKAHEYGVRQLTRGPR